MDDMDLGSSDYHFSDVNKVMDESIIKATRGYTRKS